MNHNLALLFFFALSYSQASAQVLPKEGGKLNYRLVGFSFPVLKGTNSISLEIAEGTYFKEDSFRKKIALKYNTGVKNKVIREVPRFGKLYTWRAVYSCNGPRTINGELHHFSTTTVPDVDTAITRLRIIKQAEKYKDAYVFLDGTKTLYDMRGKPVWYLSNPGGPANENELVRDIKMTPQSTITFMQGEKQRQQIYEIDYNGHILWKGPDNGAVSGDSTERYHHEFTRLANGHYMVLGSEMVASKLARPDDTGFTVYYDGIIGTRSGENANFKIPLGTLIEYDEEGRVVWSWKSANYFKSSDIPYLKKSKFMPFLDVHDNAFFFDELSKTVYISFRDISRIVKIKYPEGTVLNTYGELCTPGAAQKENELFEGQHSCRVSQKGYLYLFNNNVRDSASLPSVIMMEQPPPGKGKLKKMWEYTCDMKGYVQVDRYKAQLGGNVIELPDGAVFASMGNEYSKVFIVSNDKKLLWSAMPEKWNADKKIWEMVSGYRASIISGRWDLERLIWSTEKGGKFKVQL